MAAAAGMLESSDCSDGVARLIGADLQNGGGQAAQGQLALDFQPGHAGSDTPRPKVLSLAARREKSEASAAAGQHMPGGEVNIHLPDLHQGDVGRLGRGIGRRLAGPLRLIQVTNSYPGLVAQILSRHSLHVGGGDSLRARIAAGNPARWNAGVPKAPPGRAGSRSRRPAHRVRRLRRRPGTGRGPGRRGR